MEFIPLTEDTWPKFARLFSANTTVGGCWCTWFLRPRAEVDAGWGDGNRDFLHARVAAGAPLGWVAVAPRPGYVRLASSPITRSDGAADTWSVTCFFVHRSARRRGLAAHLLDAAIDYARDHGARRALVRKDVR